jgi:hypothetical protein
MIAGRLQQEYSGAFKSFQQTWLRNCGLTGMHGAIVGTPYRKE